MNRQHHKPNYPKITNNYNITNNNCGMMPLISINFASRPLSARPTTSDGPTRQVNHPHKPDNHPHKHNQHQHKVTTTTPSNTYICLSCCELYTRFTSCCQNSSVKLTSIFSGSGLECENLKIKHLFSNSHIKSFAQVPLSRECVAEVVNNEQLIKLYSLKSYSSTNAQQTDNNNFGRSAMIYEVPIKDCIYILIPNQLPRLYVPKYGVIQLDARNSLLLPTREHVTINNDTKKIVV